MSGGPGAVPHPRDTGHLGRHYRHELNIGFNFAMCSTSMRGSAATRPVACKPAARGVLVAGCRSVADLDLAKRIARLTGAGAKAGDLAVARLYHYM